MHAGSHLEGRLNGGREDWTPYVMSLGAWGHSALLILTSVFPYVLSSCGKSNLHGVALERIWLRQKDEVPHNIPVGRETPSQLPGREVLTEALSLLLPPAVLWGRL